MNNFTLWLEFESIDFTSSVNFRTGQVVAVDWDNRNAFCNIAVTLSDGRHYGINVWTFDFLATSVRQDMEDGQSLNGIYQIPPDLFVRELTRECIRATVADLLRRGDLEKLLNPSVLTRLPTNE